jgi:cysteine desulfurase
LSFELLEGDSLANAWPDLAVSSGSACIDASVEPSYILSALGIERSLAGNSLRIGIGRFTTDEEVDYAIKLLTAYFKAK